MDTGAGAAHLARLGAASRRTGEAGADRGRRYCADVLTSLGFVVRELSFEYSQVPGALAAPVAGGVVALAAIGLYAGHFWPPVGPVTGVGLGIALAALGWIGKRGVLDFPLGRRTGVNLEAIRAPADVPSETATPRSTTIEPTVWLVAHVDSKWQPVSMIARVVGVTFSVIGLAGLILMYLTPTHDARAIGLPVAIVTLLASIPLMLSFVGARNHGTLDNASGVAAVLEAAALVPPSISIAVLITDAEELALAGARAWSTTRVAKNQCVALNCDSVDDDGPLVAMYSGAAPTHLIAHFRKAASDQREPLRVFRLIPGILTDSVAFADAGWETLTLSRGSFRTLQRIHTHRDTLEHMRGTGISGAAHLLARVAEEVARANPHIP